MFLETVYRELSYHDGELLDATALPTSETNEARAWLEKGDWLSLAEKVNVEKIFFVENDPVIVFCQTPSNDDQTLLETFQRIWCMARPQCLFIASPGELKVFSLNCRPVQNVDQWKEVKPLAIVNKINEVSEKLQSYRREQVESGELFREKDFGGLEQRADKRLILDLKAVRQSLLNLQPDDINPRYIHALIGRSIFVRYLEDRKVLIPKYFQKVAEDRNHPKWSPQWLEDLETPNERDLSPNSEHRRYARVLRNKDFTYALFKQLAEHFNGDMFPRDPEEENNIRQEHLDLLRSFLLGDTDPKKPKLFLWAYDFEIIPIELISSIYEEFYHKSNDEDKGTHYTPSVLVEYLLSQILTPEHLAAKPKILDFACGSAIFLVQAFRRIVRYQENQLKRSLSSQELQGILRDQITGIEINEEAIHVAAFSLYLALLHYQEPKSILAQIERVGGEKPLPFLIYDEKQSRDATHFQALFHANSFSLMDSERKYLKQKLDEKKRFPNRVEFEKLYNSPQSLPFEPKSFDIIIGNPPWGYLKPGQGTPDLRQAQEHVLRWCEVFDWSIGDKEMSQAFIARTFSLLKSHGECGLLVSAGVFLKRHEKSSQFRQRWLSNSMTKKVVNFTHVRDVFFSDAISPFCFVQYKLGSVNSTHRVQYWSAKKTEVVDKIQSVVLSLPDLHQIRQMELIDNETLWKVYWWGSHRDAALINTLNLDNQLEGYIFERNLPEPSRGFQGFRENAKNYPSDWLVNYRELPIDAFTRYGEVTEKSLIDVPPMVHRRGDQEIYEGWRLLVKRGITQADNVNGRIEARLENKNYCFRNSVHGISLNNATDWERKILTAIFWSSIARYYFFMTTSSWGTWHHEIHLKDGIMNLPIRLPDDISLRNRIIEIVDELRDWNPVERDLVKPEGLSREEIEKTQNLLEQRLDKAIFELYELTEAERDLILDMCEVGLEFFYRKDNSDAVKRVLLGSNTQGTITDLAANRDYEQGLEGYLYAFLQMWNRELEAVNGEFRWRVIRPSRVSMLAIIFTTQQKGEQSPDIFSVNDESAWQELLQQLDTTLRHPVSPRIYIDGMVRAVTDTNIYIIKRDERRLWTRSLAREDTEATLLQAMLMQETVHK